MQDTDATAGLSGKKKKKKSGAKKDATTSRPTAKAGTYFRTTYFTHLDLSRMADHKAHLMIGLNTFALSLLVTKKHMGILANHHRLLVPNLILAAVCLTTIVMAIRITRPGMPPKNRAPKPENEANWVFFGDFTRYPLDVFHENIWKLMADEPRLYDALSSDLHHLGGVLARKYRQLKICYQFFFYGLLAVIVAYTVAFAGVHF